MLRTTFMIYPVSEPSTHPKGTRLLQSVFLPFQRKGICPKTEGRKSLLKLSEYKDGKENSDSE